MIANRRMHVGSALGLLLLCVACSTATSSAPDPFHEVNRSLRGQRAIVELTDGEAAVDVTHVRVSASEVSWREGSSARQVPTGEVARVIVVSQHRPSPAAVLLLVGLGLSIAFDDPLPFGIALDAALRWYAWGVEVPPAVGRVVYSGPP